MKLYVNCSKAERRRTYPSEGNLPIPREKSEVDNGMNPPVRSSRSSRSQVVMHSSQVAIQVGGEKSVDMPVLSFYFDLLDVPSLNTPCPGRTCSCQVIHNHTICNRFSYCISEIHNGE